MTMLNGQPIDNPIQSTATPKGAPPPATASPESQRVGFIAGIIAIFCAFVLPRLGAVIGGIAIGQARQGGYRNRLAVAGLVLGIVVTVLIVAAVVASVYFGSLFITETLRICQELGPDGGVRNGITYECS